MAAIQPFYEALFGWSFGTASNGVSAVKFGLKTLFHCHEIPDPAVRGKEEYWAVFFAATSLAETRSRVETAGGTWITDMALPEGPAALMHDTDRGAFVVLETGAQASTPIPWKAWLGLALTLLIVVTNQLWPWAVFFVIWVVAALRSGETYLFERVSRHDHSVLFWVLILLYSALAFLCLPIWGPLA